MAVIRLGLLGVGTAEDFKIDTTPDCRSLTHRLRVREVVGFVVHCSPEIWLAGKMECMVPMMPSRAALLSFALILSSEIDLIGQEKRPEFRDAKEGDKVKLVNSGRTKWYIEWVVNEENVIVRREYPYKGDVFQEHLWLMMPTAGMERRKPLDLKDGLGFEVVGIRLYPGSAKEKLPQLRLLRD